ncbi:MAG TPA: ROK family transcriptional regulator [Thermoclostridium sp.]|nr:ROK family transcriptional regulator [Thermoclostridium sp.]
MAKNITGNNQYLKEFNQAIVLELIRQHKRLSRKELSVLTGLSPTACGSITRALIKDGFLHETGQGESTGGRKPVMLEIKPDSYYAVGFDIGMNELKMVIADITSNILVQRSLKYSQGISVEKVIAIIRDEFFKTIEAEKLSHEKFIGCGLSIPGILDRETNKIIMAPNLSWSEVDLGSIVREVLNMPVYIENEAMCSAICEHWIGECSNIGNFVCINVESGIGAGIFIKDSIYRGHSGSAGEIGHLIVNENGRLCGCGNQGCLETYASTRYMLTEISEKLKCGYTSEIIKTTADTLTWDKVVNAAFEGDKLCLKVLERGAVFLGFAVAFLINTLNPEAIVLGKSFTSYAPLVMDLLIKTVKERALAYPASRVKIITSDFGMSSSALGAAMIPIRKVFGK